MLHEPALMNHACPHCGNRFTSAVFLDYLGWHTACPFCEGSFDVDPDPESPGEKVRKAKQRPLKAGGIGFDAGYLNGYADALAEVYEARYYYIRPGSATHGPTESGVWAWLTKAEAHAHLEAGYHLTH